MDTVRLEGVILGRPHTEQTSALFGRSHRHPSGAKSLTMRQSSKYLDPGMAL